jgi:hypothetical protein
MWEPNGPGPRAGASAPRVLGLPPVPPGAGLNERQAPNTTPRWQAAPDSAPTAGTVLILGWGS